MKLTIPLIVCAAAIFLCGIFQGSREVAKERGIRIVDHYVNWLKLLENDPAQFAKFVPEGIHPTQEAYTQVVLPVLLHDLGCAIASGRP